MKSRQVLLAAAISFFLFESVYCLYAIFNRRSNINAIQPSPDYHAELGCEFIDKNHDSNQSNIFDVRFGNESTAARIMPIPINETFETVKNALEAANQIVISRLNVNSLKDFTTFTVGVNQGEIEMNNFFNYDVVVPDDAREKSHTLALQVLTYFRESFPLAELYSHLGTVYTDIEEDQLTRIQMYQEQAFPRFFHHDITVAVVKVEDEEGRKWYLIADPFRGIIDIIAIPDADGFIRECSSLLPDADRTLHFSLLRSPQRSYILGETRDQHDVYRDLYYVELPYCSFAHTTAKLRLLKPAGSIIKRDDNGIVTSKLGYDLRVAQDRFWLYHSENNKSHTEVVPIDCIPSQGFDLVVPESNEIHPTFNDFFQKVTYHGLSIHYEVIMLELKKLKDIINTPFLDDLAEIRYNIYQAREN